MAKLKHYAGVVLGVAVALFVLNQLLKIALPSARGWLGLNG